MVTEARQANGSVDSDRWMVAWNVGESGSIEVGVWPDATDWSRGRHRTTGCCNMRWHGRSWAEKAAIMLSEFHAIVVRDGIDPQAAHREFLKIPLYREAIAPDIDGADSEGVFA